MLPLGGAISEVGDNLPAKSTEHVKNDANLPTDVVLRASRKARSGWEDDDTYRAQSHCSGRATSTPGFTCPCRGSHHAELPMNYSHHLDAGGVRVGRMRR